MATDSYAAYILIVRVVYAILSLGIIALNGWFLYYVDRLEKRGCKCALGWRRSVMEGALALQVIAAVVGLFVNWGTHFPVLALMYMTIVLTYVFVARDFIMQIKSTHCDCAETDAFKVLDIVNWIQLFYVALVMIVLLINVVWLITVGRKGPAAAAAAPAAAPARRR